eukprot:1609841-Prymnesium_polylepis.1
MACLGALVGGEDTRVRAEDTRELRADPHPQRLGGAKVLGRHDAAMSEGEPLPAALASVYVRPTPTSQLTPLPSVSMCPASQPIRA